MKEDVTEDINEMAMAIFDLLAKKDVSLALGMASLIEVIARVCDVQKIDKEKVIEAVAFRLALSEKDKSVPH